MMDRNKKNIPEGKEPKADKPIVNRLKPNEAYEPGFGKYTLTESELRAAQVNRQEAERFSERSKQHGAPTQSSASAKSNPDQTHYNGPGVNHYPEDAEGSEEQQRKMRDENTNMHNNW